MVSPDVLDGAHKVFDKRPNHKSGSDELLVSQSTSQVCSNVKFLAQTAEDTVCLQPVVTGGDQGMDVIFYPEDVKICGLNVNLGGNREKQDGMNEVTSDHARNVFVERRQTTPAGHHAAGGHKLAVGRGKMASWADMFGRRRENYAKATLEKNNEGMSTRCSSGKSWSFVEGMCFALVLSCSLWSFCFAGVRIGVSPGLLLSFEYSLDFVMLKFDYWVAEPVLARFLILIFWRS
ncbi:hypothetical protein U1Q18_025643 [Sarracenia purpurea var. burkii]